MMVQMLTFFLFLSTALSETCLPDGTCTPDAKDSIFGDASELSLLQRRSNKKSSEVGIPNEFNETMVWEDLGAGCCKGARSEENGKLWAGPMPSFADCQEKCRQYSNCGALEYGWTRGNKQWCFLWSEEQLCTELDASASSCGGGGDSGVHVYKVAQRSVEIRDLLVSNYQDKPPPVLRKRYEKCFDENLDLAGRDAVCEGDLKCARKGFDDRYFGDCGYTHCCSEEAPLARYEKCWDNGFDEASRDKACAGDLKCARRDFGGREFGDCPEYHCCSQETKHKVNTSVSLLFEDFGAGCCKGPRDRFHGKVFAGEAQSVEACMEKCLDFANCGAVEYGWMTSNKKWCYIWSWDAACNTLDTGAHSCGKGGGDNGVRVYKYKEAATKRAARDWMMVGMVCCRGSGGEHKGKLWAGVTETVEACQNKCREFKDDCAVVEYGCTGGNDKWCFIAKASAVDPKADECGRGEHDKGTHAYRYRIQNSLQERPPEH